MPAATLTVEYPLIRTVREWIGGEVQEIPTRGATPEQELLAALKVAQAEMRHSPSCCAETIECDAWACSCGFAPAYEQVTEAIAKAERRA